MILIPHFCHSSSKIAENSEPPSTCIAFTVNGILPFIISSKLVAVFAIGSDHRETTLWIVKRINDTPRQQVDLQCIQLYQVSYLANLVALWFPNRIGMLSIASWLIYGWTQAFLTQHHPLAYILSYPQSGAIKFSSPSGTLPTYHFLIWDIHLSI
jgi:hypothetical protein